MATVHPVSVVDVPEKPSSQGSTAWKFVGALYIILAVFPWGIPVAMMSPMLCDAGCTTVHDRLFFCMNLTAPIPWLVNGIYTVCRPSARSAFTIVGPWVLCYAILILAF
eukprot:TRINITY_DN47181_c0_g1_i1.p1 TRINITY_DN47181_c0_g1~~TRINITY_DN47181_c0_g1_i1.p1  ORF type:complete len:109 (-),score=1.17 TRINITY_DN47181_c0_g1_i1:358-684(-)